jgi:hypothetical protein
MLRLFQFTLRHPTGQKTQHAVARTREHAELRAEQQANSQGASVRCDSICEVGPASFVELDQQGIFDSLTRQEMLTVMAEQIQSMMKHEAMKQCQEKVLAELDCPHTS